MGKPHHDDFTQVWHPAGPPRGTTGVLSMVQQLHQDSASPAGTPRYQPGPTSLGAERWDAADEAEAAGQVALACAQAAVRAAAIALERSQEAARSRQLHPPPPPAQLVAATPDPHHHHRQQQHSGRGKAAPAAASTAARQPQHAAGLLVRTPPRQLHPGELRQKASSFGAGTKQEGGAVQTGTHEELEQEKEEEEEEDEEEEEEVVGVVHVAPGTGPVTLVLTPGDDQGITITASPTQPSSDHPSVDSVDHDEEQQGQPLGAGGASETPTPSGHAHAATPELRHSALSMTPQVLLISAQQHMQAALAAGQLILWPSQAAATTVTSDAPLPVHQASPSLASATTTSAPRAAAPEPTATGHTTHTATPQALGPSTASGAGGGAAAAAAHLVSPHNRSLGAVEGPGGAAGPSHAARASLSARSTGRQQVDSRAALLHARELLVHVGQLTQVLKETWLRRQQQQQQQQQQEEEGGATAATSQWHAGQPALPSSPPQQQQQQPVRGQLVRPPGSSSGGGGGPTAAAAHTAIGSGSGAPHTTATAAPHAAAFVEVRAAAAAAPSAPTTDSQHSPSQQEGPHATPPPHVDEHQAVDSESAAVPSRGRWAASSAATGADGSLSSAGAAGAQEGPLALTQAVRVLAEGAAAAVETILVQALKPLAAARQGEAGAVLPSPAVTTAMAPMAAAWAAPSALVEEGQPSVRSLVHLAAAALASSPSPMPTSHVGDAAAAVVAPSGSVIAAAAGGAGGGQRGQRKAAASAALARLVAASKARFAQRSQHAQRSQQPPAPKRRGPVGSTSSAEPVAAAQLQQHRRHGQQDDQSGSGKQAVARAGAGQQQRQQHQGARPTATPSIQASAARSTGATKWNAMQAERGGGESMPAVFGSSSSRLVPLKPLPPLPRRTAKDASGSATKPPRPAAAATGSSPPGARAEQAPRSAAATERNGHQVLRTWIPVVVPPKRAVFMVLTGPGPSRAKEVERLRRYRMARLGRLTAGQRQGNSGREAWAGAELAPKPPLHRRMTAAFIRQVRVRAPASHLTAAGEAAVALRRRLRVAPCASIVAIARPGSEKQRRVGVAGDQGGSTAGGQSRREQREPRMTLRDWRRQQQLAAAAVQVTGENA